MNKSNAIWLMEHSRKPLSLLDISESEVGSGSTPKYILTGICAEFDTPNDNNRIYKKEDYLKHLEYLKPQIEQGILLGSPDHDEDYHVSMRSVSHIIRDLWYDEAENNVKIKIELLPTNLGKDLIEIVKAGSPLFISSRATGYRDEQTGVVTIDTIYTYDVVYRPGFANAKLTRISENQSFTRYVAPRLVENALGEVSEFDKLRDKLISMLVSGNIDSEEKLNIWIGKYKRHYRLAEQGDHFISYIKKSEPFQEIVSSIFPDWKYKDVNPEENVNLVENNNDDYEDKDLNGNCVVTTIPENPDVVISDSPDESTGKEEPTQENPLDTEIATQDTQNAEPTVSEEVDGFRYKVGDEIEFPRNYKNKTVAGSTFSIESIKGDEVALKNIKTKDIIMYNLKSLSNNESLENILSPGDEVRIKNKESEFYGMTGLVGEIEGDTVKVTLNGIEREFLLSDIEIEQTISESLKDDLSDIISSDEDDEKKVEKILSLSDLPDVFKNTINSKDTTSEKVKYVKDWVFNAENWKEILKVNESLKWVLSFEVESSDGIKYRIVLDDYQKFGVQRSEVGGWKDLHVDPSIEDILSGKIKVDGTTLIFDPSQHMDHFKDLGLLESKDDEDITSSKDETNAILDIFDNLAKSGTGFEDILSSISTTVDLSREDIISVLSNNGRISKIDTPVEDEEPVSTDNVTFVSEANAEDTQVLELYKNYLGSGASLVEVIDYITMNTGLDIESIRDILIKNGILGKDEFIITESATLYENDEDLPQAGSKYTIRYGGETLQVSVVSVSDDMVNLISNSDDPYLKDITMEVQEFKSSITTEEEAENKANYEDILSKVAKLEESVGLLTGMLENVLRENKILRRKISESKSLFEWGKPALQLVEGKTYMVKTSNSGVEQGTYVKYLGDGFITEDGRNVRLDESSVIPTTKDISESVDPKTLVFDLKFPKLKGLRKETKAMFECLSPIRQEIIFSGLSEYSDEEVENAIEDSTSQIDFIFALEHIPAEFVGSWEALPQIEKENIISAFKLKNPKTVDEVVSFWYGVGLEETYTDSNVGVLTTGVDSSVLELGYDINDINI